MQKLKMGMVSVMVGDTHFKTGSGKSWTACRLGEMLDPDFSVDKVVYSPKEFLNVIDRIEELGKPHQVAVVDEGEITAPAALWYAWTNKAISYSLATFRYTQAMAIFVTPAFSWLDKRVRVLTSHLGFCQKHYLDFSTDPTGRGGGKSPRKSFVHLKYYAVKTDPFGEHIFLNKIKMYNQSAKQVETFRFFRVSPLSDELAEAYEAKSRLFKQELRKGLVAETAKFEAYQGREDESEKIVLKDYANTILEDAIIREELVQKGRVTRDTLGSRLEVLGKPLSTAKMGMLKKMIEQAWNKPVTAPAPIAELGL
jgi:hypothetical protein